MWLTIALRTSFAPISLPMPHPGVAVSLAMTVELALALAHQLVHQRARACRPP